MNVLPMIFLFFSGSLTLCSLCRNNLEASTNLMLILKFFAKSSTTFLLSSFRISPLSMCIQCNCFPIALLTKTAATEESTPPLNAQITLSPLTICLISAILSSTNEPAVNLFFTLQILKAKFFNPKVEDPKNYYEFNPESDKPEYFHGVKIYGPTHLHPSNFDINDLRTGASITIAALSASGKSTIDGVEYIERGYEKLADLLCYLGAEIEYIKT